VNGESVTCEPLRRYAGEGCSGEEVIDVKAVDWNRAWQVRRAGRNSSKRDARFWEGRASSFAKSSSQRGYADRFLAIMKPEAHWTVLDMGCGNGALAVPLGKMVASVTAVDLSKEMLAAVCGRCKAEGLGNVSTIHGRWEDDWGRLGIGTYDVAIASRSMVADDLGASILKLDGAARKRVYIVTIVGDGPYDRGLFDAVGRPLNLGPDYIYNYNLLYQMGILANVAFVEERRSRAYSSPEEAFASMRWMFDELAPREEERFKAYLERHLVPECGSWKCSYDRIIRWAVMWWEKE
jgi:SAM-dependent methyltransferase